MIRLKSKYFFLTDYILYFFSTFYLIVTLVKSEFLTDENTKAFYLYHLFFIFLLFILSVYFQKLKLDQKKKLTILISIFLTTYFFEITHNFIYDKRSKFEIYSDLKKNNEDISMVHIASENNKFNIVPLSGKSHSLTIFCNELGTYSIYKSDRYGFNNDDNIWDSEDLDFVLIGDSFTHGACVTRDQNIAGKLISLGYKTLNLGYSAIQC